MNAAQASVGNVGTYPSMSREKVQAEDPRDRKYRCKG